MSSDTIPAHTPSPPVPEVGVSQLPGYRRRLAFTTIILALVLEIVDTTIVNIALPAN